MSTMRRIVWYDEQGHKHVTFRSMGAVGDDATTAVAGTVPTPQTLSTPMPPATSPSIFDSIPSWAWLAGVGAAAYFFLFRKKGS